MNQGMLKRFYRKYCILSISFIIIGFLTGGCATYSTPASSSKAAPLIDIAPDKYESPNAKTLYSMARLMVLKDRKDQGEIAFRRLITEYPEFVPAYCDLAELYMEQGRLHHSIEVLNQGLEIKPDDPILLNDLGVCLLLQADYEEALQKFESASRLQPTNIRYITNRALVVGLLGRYEEAQDLYDKVLVPGHAEHNLSVIHRFYTESDK